MWELMEDTVNQLLPNLKYAKNLVLFLGLY